MPDSITLLVIDDDPMIVRFLERALSRLQCQLLSAELAEEGLRLFRENQSTIQAVILDLSLPDQPWMETIQELQKISPSVRIVISSGSLTGDNEPLQSGIFSTLPKPFSLENLSEMVQKIKAAPDASHPTPPVTPST